jgi:hypothetical protein
MPRSSPGTSDARLIPVMWLLLLSALPALAVHMLVPGCIVSSILATLGRASDSAD